ncbi:MAG: O-antigen ligase family protein [Janthinobacterium lividum]
MTPQIAQFPPDVPQFAQAPQINKKGFWTAVIGLILMTSLLLIGHQLSVLQIAYPVVTFSIAIYFYVKYPVQFIGYIWWIFFLTPEVRRLSDFVQGGFTEVSLIMLAPLLVSAPLAITIMRRLRYFGTQAGLAMLMVTLALLYGYIVGIINAGLAASTYGLSNWLTPVLVAFHLAVGWRQYPAYRTCLLRTFTIGTAVCAGYGVIQYMILPPWDAMWMIWSGMTSSMGAPFPFQVRVFGPLNSLAPFTAVVLAGVLVTTVAQNNRGRMFAAVFGVIALGLSFVRSSWGALVIGIIYQMLFFDNRTRIRIVMGALIVVAATIPVFMSSNVSDNLETRLSTLTDLKNDNSFSARSDFYQTFLDTALTNIAGIGVGGTGLSTKLSGDASATQYKNFDSGIMEIPFVLGWPGTLLYVFGLGWMIVTGAIAALRTKEDRFSVAWFSMAIAMLSQLIFGNSMIGPAGQLAFMGMVFPVMALRYNKYQATLARNAANAQVLP